MAVRGPHIHLQLPKHGAPQRPFRQHALYGQLEHPVWLLLDQPLETVGLQAARITGVPVVDLVFALVAAHLHPLRIDDHDVVAGIHVRRIARLVLALQPFGDFAGQAPQDFIRRIHQVPLPGDLSRFGAVGLRKSLHQVFIFGCARNRNGPGDGQRLRRARHGKAR